MNLNLNMTLFNEITLNNCLNYSVIEDMEKMVHDKVQSSINKMSKYKKSLTTKEDKIRFILEQSLLKISGNNVFLKNKNALNLELLYTIIKKQIYLQSPFLLS